MSAAHAPDVRKHVAAIKAALPAVQLFDYGEVPGLDGNGGTTPPIHGLIVVDRRAMPSLKSSRHTTRTGWRVSLRLVGTTANEARWAWLKACALEDQRLVVDGRTTTPIQHESSEDAARDSGWFAAAVTFTYAI